MAAVLAARINEPLGRAITASERLDAADGLEMAATVLFCLASPWDG